MKNLTAAQTSLKNAEAEMKNKTRVFNKEKDQLQKTYDAYKSQEEQKEMETKALLSQTLQSLEKYKGMDNMKEEQY